MGKKGGLNIENTSKLKKKNEKKSENFIIYNQIHNFFINNFK